MTLVWQCLHDVDLQRLAQMRRHAQFEELPVAVPAQVHGEILRFNPRSIALMPTRRDFAHFHTRTHGSELGFKLNRIHVF